MGVGVGARRCVSKKERFPANVLPQEFAVHHSLFSFSFFFFFFLVNGLVVFVLLLLRP